MLLVRVYVQNPLDVTPTVRFLPDIEPALLRGMIVRPMSLYVYKGLLP